MTALLLFLVHPAMAAQTLTGDVVEINYNDEGTWNNSDIGAGLRASFDGGETWAEFTYAGYPWQRFALAFTQGGEDQLYYSVSYGDYSNVTVTDESDLSTASDLWSAYSYQAGDLDVVKDEIWPIGEGVVLVRFLITNTGSDPVEGLRLNFAVDPDQDSPTAYTTKNNTQNLDDVGGVDWSESVGTTTGYALGFGACAADTVEMGHYAGWSSNVTADIALTDEGNDVADSEMNLRYTRSADLEPGQTTALSLLVVVAETEREAEDLYLDNTDRCSTCDDDGDGAEGALCGGDDCDDGDPSVLPSATETWYDGVDQDCAADDDFDADADGHASDAHDGDDCDDTDASVNPSATETWYDGVDQDCAGDDDNDADADGSAVPEDCDDANPAVNPGATEVWYDGVDDNCDDNDEDQDGDGVAVDADCDDADPLRSDESDCEGSGQADDTASTDVLGDGELSGKGCAITPTPAGLLLALGGLLTLTRRQRRS